MHSKARKGAWYLAPTALNGVVALGAIPLLIANVGVENWASIALGQSVGLIASVMVSMGWPVVGPAVIASSSRIAQERHMRVSFISRLLIAAPLIGLMAVSALVVPGLWNSLVTGTAIATCLMGLTSAWYYLGLDRPIALFLSDSLTRSGGTVLGLILTVMTSDPLFFVAGILSGNILAAILPLLFARSRRGRQPRIHPRIRPRELFKNSTKGAAVNFSYVLLSTLAMPIVGALSAEILIAYALYDKLQKQFSTLLLPVAQMIVGRLAKSRDASDIAIISASSRRAVVVAGLVAALFCIPIAPTAAAMISLGSVQMQFLDSVLFACLVGAGFISQALPVAVLAPLKGLGYATLANVVGLLVMVPSVMYGGRLLGTTGILLASSLAFLVVVFLLNFGVHRRLRSQL